MSISLNGSIGSLYLGSTKIGEAYLGSVKILSSEQPVISVPAGTFRFKFGNTSFVPTSNSSSTTTAVSKYGTWSAVDASRGIWDVAATSSGLGGFCFSSDKDTGDVWLLAGNYDRNINMEWSSSKPNAKLTKIFDLYNTSGNASGQVTGFKSCPNLTYFRSYKGVGSTYTTSTYTNFLNGCSLLTAPPELDANFGGTTVRTASHGGARAMFYGCSSLQNMDDWFRDVFVYSNAARYLQYDPLKNYNKKDATTDNIASFYGVPNTIIPDYLGGSLAKSLLTTKTVSVRSTDTYITMSAHPGDIFYLTVTRNANGSNSDYLTVRPRQGSNLVVYPIQDFKSTSGYVSATGWILSSYRNEDYSTTRTVYFDITKSSSMVIIGTVTIKQYTFPY